MGEQRTDPALRRVNIRSRHPACTAGRAPVLAAACSPLRLGAPGGAAPDDVLGETLPLVRRLKRRGDRSRGFILGGPQV